MALLINRSIAWQAQAILMMFLYCSSTFADSHTSMEFDQLSPMGKLQYRTIDLIMQDISVETDSSVRQSNLQELLQQSEMLKGEASNFMEVWIWRAQAALELDDWRVGHEAGQELLRLGALESSDEQLLTLMANLNRRLWLSKSQSEIEMTELKKGRELYDDGDLDDAVSNEVNQILSLLASGDAWGGFTRLKSIRLKIGPDEFDYYPLTRRALALAMPIAAAQNDDEMFRAGITSGGDLNAEVSGQSSLHWVASHGNDGLVKLLIAAGANVTGKNQRGQSILIDPVWKGSASTVKLLIDAGASPTTDGRKLPLIQEALELRHGEIADILIKAGARLDSLENDQLLAKMFHEAIADDDIELVQLLVTSGMDGSVIYNDATMLKHAKKQKKKEIYAYLKQHPGISKKAYSSGSYGNSSSGQSEQ